MAELPWFPLYARDWLAGEGTSMMLPEQEGAFIRLLCVAWGDGSCEPSIPTDDKALAQITRLGARWKRLGGLVRAQFKERDGRLYNAKLSSVWTEQRERSQRLAENGRKGGKAKAMREPGLSPEEAGLKQSESDAESEMIDDERGPVVDGSAIGEPALTALYLTIWANGAITERWGEQPSPLTPSGSHELAEHLKGLGASWQIVRDSIYRQCRESRLVRPPRSANYFRAGVEQDLERESTKLAMAASGEDAPPPKPGIAARTFASTLKAIEDIA